MKTTDDDTDILIKIDQTIDAHSQFTLARRVERICASAAEPYEVGYEDTGDPHQDECDFSCDMQVQELVFDIGYRIAAGTDDDGSEWATHVCHYLVARNIYRPDDEDLAAWSPHVISPHIKPVPYPPGFRRPRQSAYPDTSAQTREDPT